MTTLYADPVACSQAAHIAARMAGLSIDVEWVDMPSRKLADGTDDLLLAPKGKVPVLVLGDGTRITVTAAVLQWIADQRPEAGLAPRAHATQRPHQCMRRAAAPGPRGRCKPGGRDVRAAVGSRLQAASRASQRSKVA